MRREGAGQWALIGPPNAGKSALLKALTHAHPEVAPYPFTTHAPQPGMMPFEDLQVQLVDTPAVTAQHAEPYMTHLVHSADGTLLVLDVTADDLEDGVAVLHALLERSRVWPAARPLPAEHVAPTWNNPAGQRDQRRRRSEGTVRSGHWKNQSGCISMTLNSSRLSVVISPSSFLICSAIRGAP